MAQDPMPVGWLLVVAGLLIAGVGVLAMTGALSWFGHLPGDLRIEREGLRVYVPLASMLLVSVVLTLLMALIRR